MEILQTCEYIYSVILAIYLLFQLSLSTLPNTLTYDATLRNMELIGEAATHVPDEIRKKHPEIQWRSIVATRNRLAHGYLGTDDDIIWDIIQNDITELLPALRNLLSTVNKT